MRGDLNFFAIAAVAVIVFASISVYVAGSSGGSSDDTELTTDDLIGHWYLAMELSFIGDEYVKNTPVDKPDIGIGDIDIRNSSGNVFYGTQFGVPITGSFSNGILEITTQYHGEYTKYLGCVDSKSTFTLANAHGHHQEDGTISEIASLILVFTKDPSRVLTEVPGYMDVTGEWKLIDDTFLRNGNYGSFGYGDLNITIQHDNLFQGEFDLSDARDREIKGVMFKYGTIYRGLVITAVGNVAILNITAEGVFTTALVNSNDEGNYSYASCATFTRGDSTSFEKSGLVGTSWSVRDFNSIDGVGNATRNVKLYTLIFEEEKNGVVRGTWKYGAEQAEFSGYVHENSSGLFIEVSWCEDDRMSASKIGYLNDNGSMVLSSTFIDRNGTPVTQSYTLEAVTYTETDIVGHWYMTRTVGFDNGFFDVTMYDTPYLGMLDFDIYDVRNGQVHAWYMGGNIVASYLDGLLYCENARVDGTMEYIQGWLESDGTMTCMITHSKELPDGTLETGMSYATFTKDRGPITSLNTGVDITGDWTAIDPVSMDFNGDVHSMNGTRLTVDKEVTGVFTGKMEQTVDNRIVTLDIRGVVVMTTWGTIQGRIIDSHGLVWNLQIAGGCLVLNATDISPVTAIKGEMDTVERRYIPAGSADPGFEYLENIVGRTWSGDTLYVMDDYGNQTVMDTDLRMTIVHQHNNLLSGICIDPYTGDEIEWVAYLLNSVGQPMFSVQMERYGYEDVCNGLAWTYNGNTYLMVAFTDDDLRGYVSTIQLTEVLPQ